MHTVEEKSKDPSFRIWDFIKIEKPKISTNHYSKKKHKPSYPLLICEKRPALSKESTRNEGFLGGSLDLRLSNTLIQHEKKKNHINCMSLNPRTLLRYALKSMLIIVGCN